jgi:RNA polymerase sigma factor (sigma-70 family)
MEGENDDQLLDGLRNEEPWAFEKMYKDYFRKVAAYVVRNKGSEDDARDVFQDALVALVGTLRRPEFSLQENVKLIAYFFGIVRNIWLAELKKRGKLPPGELPPGIEPKDDAPKMEEIMERERRLLSISGLVEKIGEDCRKLLLAFYYEGKSHEEIAEMMGYTKGFTRVKKYRCIEEIRKRMDD